MNILQFSDYVLFLVGFTAPDHQHATQWPNAVSRSNEEREREREREREKRRHELKERDREKNW